MIINGMYISGELILIIVIGIAGMLVQWRLTSVFRKYSGVPLPHGMTGRDIAEKMLHDSGISDVRVISTPGRLTDHYNPSDKTINLSEAVYNQNSISAAAVAAHETGHAVQHARAYGPLKMRSALVPVITVTSKWSFLVVIAGILVISVFPALFWLGIGMIAVSALFSIITLPVEFNASARAMEWLRTSGTLQGTQLTQAKTALGWAASTYLVAALSAIATLIYYISIGRGRE